MPQPVIYKSTCSGNLEHVVKTLSNRPCTVSITIDDGLFFPQDDPADYRVYVQVEPIEVLEWTHKDSYPDLTQDTVSTLIDRHKFYDLILAWDERILEACPNAVFFPHCHDLQDSGDPDADHSSDHHDLCSHVS